MGRHRAPADDGGALIAAALGVSAQLVLGVGLVADLLAVTILGVGIVTASIRLHRHTRGRRPCDDRDGEAVRYRPSCSSAFTMGAREALIIPSSGRLSSRIKKSAAEAERAQTRRTTMTVASRGAKSPKVP